MTGRPKFAATSKNEPLSTTALMIGTHLVDLAAVARHRRHQRLLRSFRIVVAGDCRRQLVDRRRQIREKTLRAGERFLLGVDGMIDAAGAGLDIGAAEFLLAEILAEPLHNRRPGDEHRRVFCHHRIMAGRKPRRAQSRDRAQPQAHHRHAGHVRGRVRVPAGAADAARQIRRALGFDGFHRAAAAGAFDQPDDGQAEDRAPSPRPSAAWPRSRRRPSRRAR